MDRNLPPSNHFPSPWFDLPSSASRVQFDVVQLRRHVPWVSTTMTFINGGFCARYNPNRNKGTFDRSASNTFVIWISSLAARGIVVAENRKKEESQSSARISSLSLSIVRSLGRAGEERLLSKENELNWADGGICTSPSHQFAAHGIQSANTKDRPRYLESE